MTTRALMYDVAGFVIHHKAISLASILPAFPQKTKHQVQNALQNASDRKLIKCVKAGKAFVWGPRDVSPADYLLKHGPKGIRSVFDLTGVPLPQWRGTRHQPLGGWDE